MTTKNSLSHPQYRPDIDGLRAIAILFVVAFHAFPNWVKGGFIGVDIFFVISGYLISTIIFENLDKGSFSFAEFYARRINRIFPALLLVLGTSFVFGWYALLDDEYKQLGKHIAASAGFVSNIVFWNEAGYFDNLSETKPLLHLWSLAVEEQIYIVWPLFLWLARKVNFSPLKITIIVSVASFYLNVKLSNEDIVAAFYFPQTRFWEFLCGSILACVTVYKNHAFGPFREEHDGWIASAVFRKKCGVLDKMLIHALALTGLTLLIYGAYRINKQSSFPSTWALVPVLGTVLIIVAGPRAWLNQTVLSHRITVWFGLISYPLYLWHWPLLSFLTILESGSPSIVARIAVVSFSIALAWLTHIIVERPIILGRRGMVKTVALVVLMSFAGFAGQYVYLTDGLYNRRNRDGLSLSGYFDSKLLLADNSGLGPSCTVDGSRSSETCQYGTNPSVLLWGDSYAAHLAMALVSSPSQHSFLQHTLISCRPILGVSVYSESRNKKWGEECIRHNTSAISWLSKNNKIKYVIIASPFTIYEELLLEGKVTKGSYDIFLSQIRMTIRELRSLGLRPVIVAPPPWSNENTGRCWLRNMPNRSYERCNFALNSSPDTTNVDALMAKVEEFAPVFYLENLICKMGTCFSGINGYPIYRDSGHLSISGSSELGKEYDIGGQLIRLADDYWTRY